MDMTPDTFRTLVRSAPLISIDLVVVNARSEVLLGMRTNRPAQNTWFVPGGRIWKGESLDTAFRRIAENELGTALERQSARFLGVYEHHYADNYFNDPGYGTHYIVLGHRLELDSLPDLPKEQHTAYRWWPVEELLAAEDVHANTKAYFL